MPTAPRITFRPKRAAAPNDRSCVRSKASAHYIVIPSRRSEVSDHRQGSLNRYMRWLNANATKLITTHSPISQGPGRRSLPCSGHGLPRPNTDIYPTTIGCRWALIDVSARDDVRVSLHFFVPPGPNRPTGLDCGVFKASFASALLPSGHS
jgi:hypothetical protein